MRRPELLLTICVLSPVVFARGQNNYPPPFPPRNGIVVGPSYKLSEIRATNDLVKLSGDWWGIALNQFPSAVRMKSGDYTVGDDRDPAKKNFKVLMPRGDFSSLNWSPEELPPLVLSFKSGQGLIEISGIIHEKLENRPSSSGPLPEGVTPAQASVVRALAARYGKPTRIIAYPMAPGLGVTYVWYFDKSILEITSWTFRIFRASDLIDDGQGKAP